MFPLMNPNDPSKFRFDQVGLDFVNQTDLLRNDQQKASPSVVYPNRSKSFKTIPLLKCQWPVQLGQRRFDATALAPHVEQLNDYEFCVQLNSV